MLHWASPDIVFFFSPVKGPRTRAHCVFMPCTKGSVWHIALLGRIIHMLSNQTAEFQCNYSMELGFFFLAFLG